VFSPEWNKGIKKCSGGDNCECHSASKRKRRSDGHCCVPIFNITGFNFLTIRNLVHFAYTGHVNLHGRVNRGGVEEELCHKDAFSLYKAASEYQVERLRRCCFRYLCVTCTPSNVLNRLMDPNIRSYQRLQNYYLIFLRRRHREVRNSLGQELKPEIDVLLELAKTWESRCEDDNDDTSGERSEEDTSESVESDDDHNV
jgi:hypothetical protein